MKSAVMGDHEEPILLLYNSSANKMLHFLGCEHNCTFDIILVTA